MKWLVNLWRTLARPSKTIAVGVIILVAFVAGIVFWVGFNTTIEHTSTEKFCISCHSMESKTYKELQETVHWSNDAGVRAKCQDCHIPHDLGPKLLRKMEAANDILGWLTGTIDTPEKFEAKRLEMAQREWARFDANKSAACKVCHDYKSMKWESMSKLAQQQMKPAAAKDQSCMDCHKGIAHHLPDMGKAAAPTLTTDVSNSITIGQEYYSAAPKALFADEKTTVEAGTLNVATKVTALAVKGQRVQVSISGWRKEMGVGRVLYSDFGINILQAQLTKAAAVQDGVIKPFEEKEDQATGLKWQRVEYTIWTKKDNLIDKIQPLWELAQKSFKTSCSVCHSQPQENQYDANTWPGIFKGMSGFAHMDSNTSAIVQKYLQQHSSTFDKEPTAKGKK